jgi:hypothetical protein
MAHTDWYIEGKSFGNCNCVYGCPCQFEDIPTDGHCNGVEVLHIDKGNFGGVDLAGLRTAMLYAWPGPVFEGNGQMQAIIDERANDAQRAMSSTVHETLYKPIDCEIDIEARTARVSIPGILTSSGRPIRAPHSGGAEHRVRIDIPGGIEFDFAEVGSASTKATGAIKLDLNDSYGQWHTMRHAPSGVVQHA